MLDSFFLQFIHLFLSIFSQVMGISRPCTLLIVIAGMERFAFKGVGSNLVTYLTQEVKLSNSGAAKMVNSWSGFSSMLPLLIAPLADAYWDRFSTVLGSSFFYVLGLLALTSTALVSTWFPNNSSSSYFLFWSLCVVSIGAAGFNPSLQAFGTDQLESEEQQLPQTKDNVRPSSDKKSQLFQWWYFGVCSGSLMGITFMSYVQDTFGWVVGFAIPTGAMVSSIILFCCGNRIYAHKQDDIDIVPRSLFRDLAKVVRATIGRFVHVYIEESEDENTNLTEFEMQERPLCGDELKTKNLTADYKPGNLENSKVILRLLPIWTTLLMFAVIFQQPATFFTKQGMVMKRNIGPDFMIPPATLQSAITLSIILLMPLYDKMLIPFTRLFTHNDRGITVMQRMGIGMFLSIVAMIIAAQVEMKRLELGKTDTSPPSIFWLLPQYILLGISDVFTVVGMQEFFYSEVPLRMRTMGFALYTSVFGVGSFLSALMISIIEVLGGSWFSDDMNEARLDKYYWVLAAGSALSLVLYIMLCKLYRCRNDVEGGSNC